MELYYKIVSLFEVLLGLVISLVSFIKEPHKVLPKYSPKNYNKLLVPRIDYESNPFYGFNELPSFISPFSDEFLEEIIFLKSFVINYLNQKIILDLKFPTLLIQNSLKKRLL